MKKLILLVCLALVGCKEAPSNTAASLPEEPPVQAPIIAPIVTPPVSKIYIFGDEISAGDGVTNPYWKELETASGKSIENRSYSNATGGIFFGAGGVSTMNTTLDLNNNNLGGIGPSDIIIIFVGYTDVRWYGNVGGNFSSFFTPFINAAYNTGAQIYIVSPIKMNAGVYNSFSPLNNGSDSGMATFSGLLQNAANGFNSSGVVYVDMINQFNPVAQNLQANLQYPNDTGHLVIASVLKTAMGL